MYLTFDLNFSIIGAIIIAIGLYGVVWGKSKDHIVPLPLIAEKDGGQELPITTISIEPTVAGNNNHKLAGDFTIP